VNLFSLDIVAIIVDVNYLMLYLGVSLFLIFQNKVINGWVLLFVITLIFLAPKGYKWALYAGEGDFPISFACCYCHNVGLY
jgi:hypothetical protein